MSIFSKLFGGKKGGSGGGAGNAQAFISRLQADLNLSADQASKVETAIRAFMQEKKSVKQSGGSKEDMRESRQDFKQDVMAVLNAEQQQKFMANLQTYKQLLKGR